MKLPFPQTWKDIWDKWDLRAFIVLSLAFQTFLIFFAPLRKRTSRIWIIMPIWSAYLLADSAATFCVGLISSSQNDLDKKTSAHKNGDLLAFWAPFLLVHLGGPDTITAFALADNELWLRHLLGLLFQLLATLYVFYQTLPKTSLWLPTTLMFISGIIKYAERTCSLYRASLNSFRDSMYEEPDPGPNYAKLMDEYFSKKEAKLPTRIQFIGEPDRGDKAVNKVKQGSLSDVEVVLYAHRFFQSFKGLIVDLIFSFRERNESRTFFLARRAEDAFKVVEVELNFIYEVLYTKVSVLYTTPGYICRFVSFSCVVASLVLFHVKPKRTYDPVDVGITYTLLYAAIALDIIAFLMLIQSDWALITTKKLPEVDLNDSERESSKVVQLISCFWWISNYFIHRKWSESVSTYNLIYYCLHPRMDVEEKLIGYIGMTNVLDGLAYVKVKSFTEELRDHIFRELWKKSEIADDLDTAKEISASRGDWVLRMEGCVELLPYISAVDYDESLLLWHIATDLCYNDEIPPFQKSEPPENKYRDFSKLLSDYMIYLLVMQPTLMSAVTGIGQIRFRDTCAEAKKFFNRRNLKKRKKEASIFKIISYVILSIFKCIGISLYLFFLSLVCIVISPLLILLILCGGKLLLQRLKTGLRFHNQVIMVKLFGREKESDRQKKACQDILGVNTEVKPVTVKGDRSKSVLFDGCILAKKLREIEKSSDGKCKWKIMSQVWVELLSYAAIHCRANTHVEQLSKGGELITIVWLLMAHFGLGEQFQISEGHARAKLIVGK